MRIQPADKMDDPAPTTLASLGAQVGTVCICLFQNDLKRKLAKLLPGQSDQTSLKPLDVK